MRIGITGSYASGKGTVCDFFKGKGAIIIDTDILARELVVPGSPALEKIVTTFGSEFLNEDLSLNRKKLGEHVFSDKKKVTLLNDILHPLILQETLNRSENKALIYIINAPLLFEAGFDRYTHPNIVVISSVEQSIERGMKRDGLSKEEIMNRLSSQFSLNEKIKRADYIIDNSDSLEKTRIQAEEIWNNLIISSQKAPK